VAQKLVLPFQADRRVGLILSSLETRFHLPILNSVRRWHEGCPVNPHYQQCPNIMWIWHQYLRDDLVSAVREFFYHLESSRPASEAYDNFAHQRVCADDTLITFNYDVALERGLKGAGRWDVGSGYGFPLFADSPASPVTVFKLHGSVNWFQTPLQQAPPPLMFPRDLDMLGYQDRRDTRIGANGCAVNNSGTLILPDTDKRFYWERLWLPLWDSAARQLRSAGEVFIHGYSLPSADARARRLLFDNVSPHAPVHIFCWGASERIAAGFRQRGFADVRPNPETGFEVWSSGNVVETR